MLERVLHLCDSLFLQFDYLCQELAGIREAALDVTDYAGLVDDEGGAARAEKLLHLAVVVGHKREGEAVLLGKFAVRRYRVAAHAQDLGVLLLKKVLLFLKS